MIFSFVIGYSYIYGVYGVYGIYDLLVNFADFIEFMNNLFVCLNKEVK